MAIKHGSLIRWGTQNIPAAETSWAGRHGDGALAVGLPYLVYSKNGGSPVVLGRELAQCLQPHTSLTLFSLSPLHPLSFSLPPPLSPWLSISLSISFCHMVVKEEISDDNAKLPCFNGRVVSWVSAPDCL